MNHAQERNLSPVRKMTTVAVMSACAYLLMLIEFPIPIMPSFIKMDFSELPALLTSFALGPGYGILVCLIKNLLHLPFTSSSGVGELSNFLLGCFFCLPAGFIYKFHRNKKSALLGALIGAFCMAIVSFPSNYFVVYPFYTNFMPMEGIIAAYHAILPSIDSLPKALLIFNVPFTLVKGLLDVLLTFLIYKRISPIIQGSFTPKKKVKKAPEEALTEDKKEL